MRYFMLLVLIVLVSGCDSNMENREIRGCTSACDTDNSIWKACTKVNMECFTKCLEAIK